MKKTLLTIVVGLCSLVGMNACASNSGDSSDKSHSNDKKEKTEMKTDGKKLVVFFSHTGENYNVGYVEKGNTHVVADMIADASGADKFEIVPEKEYPKDSYNECIEIAKQEKLSDARPAIKGDVRIEDYDVIFLGYPNWWGELPMCVYTFMDKHDWAGKTVIPFITHEGSGMGGTDRKIASYLKDADVAVGKGLAIQGKVAQENRDSTKKSVEKWIEALNIK